MARPKKNNADYFSHDADMRNDVRIRAVRRKFKLTGYAVWSCILEVLTDSDFFMIDWTPTSIEMLSGDFDIEPAELREIVDYCVSLELLQIENNKLFCEKHQKRFEILTAKRNRSNSTNQSEETPQNEVIDDENPATTGNGRVIDDENTQSKVKYSKVKEIKGEKKEKEKKDFDFSFCLPEYLPILRGWLDYKELQGQGYKTQSGAEAVYRKLLALSDNNAATAALIVEQSYASNWVQLYELPKNAANPQNANIGAGERIVDGRRTYGSGKITIPPNAPPRPSGQYAWNESTQSWVVQ